MSRQCRRLGPALLLLLGCMTLFALGRTAGHEVALGLTPAHAEDDGPRATVERVTMSGLEGGRVMLKGQEIAVLGVAHNGFSGYERALIVADRLNRHLPMDLTPRDVIVRALNGASYVEVHGEVIVTVTRDDARLLQGNPSDVAERWASNLRVALGGQPAGGPPPDGDEDLVWPPREAYDDKYVPILTLLEGVRVGVARINGPRSRVREVQGITQFSIDFANFVEIDIYVPVRVSGGLDRIQGVGVTGLGDIRL